MLLLCQYMYQAKATEHFVEYQPTTPQKHLSEENAYNIAELETASVGYQCFICETKTSLTGIRTIGLMPESIDICANCFEPDVHSQSQINANWSCEIDQQTIQSAANLTPVVNSPVFQSLQSSFANTSEHTSNALTQADTFGLNNANTNEMNDNNLFIGQNVSSVECIADSRHYIDLDNCSHLGSNSFVKDSIIVGREPDNISCVIAKSTQSSAGLQMRRPSNKHKIDENKHENSAKKLKSSTDEIQTGLSTSLSTDKTANKPDSIDKMQKNARPKYKKRNKCISLSNEILQQVFGMKQYNIDHVCRSSLDIDETIFCNNLEIIKNLIDVSKNSSGVRVKTIFEATYTSHNHFLLSSLKDCSRYLGRKLRNLHTKNTQDGLLRLGQTETKPFLLVLPKIFQNSAPKPLRVAHNNHAQEQYSSLTLVTDIHKFFCVDDCKDSRASILKLEILEILPEFHELPLFLDLIKFASFDGQIHALEEKLEVLDSFLDLIRKNFKLDSSSKILQIEGFDKTEFIKLSRHHILRYLKIEGRTKQSFKFYSHAMVMKQTQGLTDDESKSLDAFLYFAFIIHKVWRTYIDPINAVYVKKSGFIIFVDKTVQFSSQKLMSINDIYKGRKYNLLLLKKVNHYITECLYSCNIDVLKCYRRTYVCSDLDILVAKNKDKATNQLNYKAYTLESLVIECFKSYTKLVEYFHKNRVK